MYELNLTHIHYGCVFIHIHIHRSVEHDVNNTQCVYVLYTVHVHGYGVLSFQALSTLLNLYSQQAVTDSILNKNKDTIRLDR